MIATHSLDPKHLRRNAMNATLANARSGMRSARSHVSPMFWSAVVLLWGITGALIALSF